LGVVLRRVSKAYGFLWALRDVNLTLSHGDFVALLGPNGAGKTTLLRLLCALHYPTSGEIEIDGEPLDRGKIHLRSAIGFLSPDGQIYDKLTARENLRFFTSLSGKEMKSAEISHGMKCRLAIAKWSLLKPRFFLLDEPYGVLDGPGVDLLESFLKNLCHGGAIVVIATHNVHRVLGLCTRALILQGGGIIFDEPRREPWKSFHEAFANFLPSEA